MARSASKGACLAESVTTTVCGSGAVIVFTGVSRKPQPPLYARDRSIEKTTSLAVSGEPSENFASRRWNV